SGAGNATFQAGAVAIDGAWSLAGALTVNGGTADFNATDPVTTLAPASLAVSSGTLDLGRALTTRTATLSGGTIRGSSDLTIDGSGSPQPSLTWSSGFMGGSGATTTIAAGGALNLTTTSAKYLGYPGLPARALVNNGTGTWSGGYMYSYTEGASFTNAGTLAVDVPSGHTFGPSDQTGAAADPVFTNTGTLTKTGAGAFDIGYDFVQDGSATVSAGTLSVDGGGSATGSVAVETGAALRFNGHNYALGAASSVSGAGNATFQAGAVAIDGAYDIGGTTLVNGGAADFNAFPSIATLVVSSGAANVNGEATVPSVSQTGGTIGGFGTFFVSGLYEWSAGTQTGVGQTGILEGAVLELEGSGFKTINGSRAVINFGTTIWSGSGNWGIGGAPSGGTPGGTFSNDTTGTFEIRNNGTLHDLGSGLFLNSGFFTKTGVAGGGFLGNPGADDAAGATSAATASATLPSWTRVTSQFSAVEYGATGFPTVVDSEAIGGGRNFFAGGPGGASAESKATQAFGVSAYAGTIDAGEMTARLDGYLGGKGSEADSSTVTARFLNGSGTELATLQIGPVTAADRGNVTKLLPRAGSRSVPVGTRTIEVVIAATRSPNIGYNDGYADSVNLELVDPDGVVGQTTIGVPFQNTGVGPAGGVIADEGVVAFTVGTPGGGAMDTGTYLLERDGVVDFAGGTREIAADASLTGEGTIRFGGGTTNHRGTYDVGRTVIVNGIANLTKATADAAPALTDTLVQTAGQLRGDKTVTIAQRFAWSGGHQGGVGTTVVPAGSKLAVTGGGTKVLSGTRILRNEGAGSMTGTGHWQIGGTGVSGETAGGTFDNRSRFEIANDRQIYDGSGGQIANDGTLAKVETPGGSTATSLVSVPTTNDGTVAVEAGTLDFGSVLTNWSSGAKTLTGGTYLLESTLRLASADIVTNAATIVLDGPAAQILDTTSPGNDGLRNFATNSASGAFTIKNGKDFSRAASFANAGALTVGADSTFASAGYAQTAGTTSLAETTSVLDAGVGGTVDIQGGVLEGVGTVGPAVRNASEVQPGTSPGVLNVAGSYTQTSAGALRVEIGGTVAGTEHDQLQVTGAASLDGTLAIETLSGFAPASGDVFEVLTGTRSGTFATVTGADLPGGLLYDPIYHAESVELFVGGANTVPTVSAGADAAIAEGATFSSSGSFTDPDDGGSWTATVDYGDGSGPQALTLGADKSFALGHVYADDGSYTVTVTVTDERGASASDTAVVTVTGVAPSVDAGADKSIAVGATMTGSGSFTDPGADTWTATVDWGDGTPVASLTLDSDKTFDLSHGYAAAGTYTVTVSVTDDDGDSGSDTLTVSVTPPNSSPSVDLGADANISEGGTFTRSGSFTDADAGDEWTATVDYGDGAGPQALALDADKTFALSHVYADDGAYTVTVVVSDGSRSGSDTAQVTVANAAPAVAAGADKTIFVGDTMTSAGSFSDPGADTWAATVDWGDGTVVAPLALNPDKAFELSHEYASVGTYTVTVSVTDDDGDSGADTMTVTVEELPSTRCVLDEDVLTIALGDPRAVTVVRDGQAIVVKGLPSVARCSTATVTKVDRIVVTGSTGNDSLTIDLRGGPFAPGKTAETRAPSEIEWDVDLGGGSDGLVFTGSARGDAIVFGANGVNLQRDGDTDVTLGAIERFTANGGGGNDVLSAGGKFGTGRAFSVRITLAGGAGPDALTGGFGADKLDGGAANDIVTGGGGKDVVKGGAGSDRLMLRDGVADKGDGGSGRDTAKIDRGLDRLIGVEKKI
ncbi:MAG: hypothetical protein KY396_00895, partial [Actinobacteria bacterium]|nr:hypothetical protein [Actinomycetota bacterium]